MRVIGDVHGKYESYLKVADSAERSLQLGDMGFNYVGFNHDESRHKFFGGNHDNYDQYNECTYQIGHWGKRNHGGVEFFFVRGAFSVDFKPRIVLEKAGQGKTWWNNEQLNYIQMGNAYDDYVYCRPDLMITHTCPHSVVKYVETNNGKSLLRHLGYNPNTFTTNTQELLQAMFEAYQPKKWIFGHFHVDRKFEVNGTEFICLPELGYVDVN